VSGATASDNPGSSRTDVTITGSGGIVKQVAIAGVLLPPEVTINFVTGATAVDNPGSSRTDVTLASGGYSIVQNNGTSVTAETKLNFIGFTVADDGAHGRTNITAPGSALYGTHTLTGNITLTGSDAANTMFYFTPSGGDFETGGWLVTITETLGVPRMIYVANSASTLGYVFRVAASTGQATPVWIYPQTGSFGGTYGFQGGTRALMYTGDATIGYL
jgi:hypothetical protein